MENSILDKIRPFYLVDGLREAHKQDSDWFKSRKNNYKVVACPACGSSQFVDFFEKEGAKFLRCSICNMLYLSPRPSKEDYKNFFLISSAAQYFNKAIFPAAQDDRKTNIYKPRLERILSVLQKKAPDFLCLQENYLEIGAGAGDFASLVYDAHIFNSVTVVEPNPSHAASCRDKKLNTINSPIEEVHNLKEKMGFVASFECIEHICNVDEYIDIIKSMLRNNGILCLTCPNGMGLDVVELREHSTTVDWEHPNLFSPMAIRIFLQKHGFNILELCTPGILDVELLREAVREGSWTFPPASFLDQVIDRENEGLDTRFQKFLVDNLLSSHMLVIARKQ